MNDITNIATVMKELLSTEKFNQQQHQLYDNAVAQVRNVLNNEVKTYPEKYKDNPPPLKSDDPLTIIPVTLNSGKNYIFIILEDQSSFILDDSSAIVRPKEQPAVIQEILNNVNGEQSKQSQQKSDLGSILAANGFKETDTKTNIKITEVDYIKQPPRIVNSPDNSFRGMG